MNFLWTAESLNLVVCSMQRVLRRFTMDRVVFKCLLVLAIVLSSAAVRLGLRLVVRQSVLRGPMQVGRWGSPLVRCRTRLCNRSSRIVRGILRWACLKFRWLMNDGRVLTCMLCLVVVVAICCTSVLLLVRLLYVISMSEMTLRTWVLRVVLTLLMLVPRLTVATTLTAFVIGILD